MPSRDSPAGDDDRWVRHLIGSKGFKNNKLTAAYIRRYLEPVSDRRWQAEISGRLLSLAFDWLITANREVRRIGQAHIKLRGMAFVDVAELRGSSNNFDVLKNPTCSDWAHANLIAWRAPLAEVDADVTIRDRVSEDVIRELVALLRVSVTQQELVEIETCRCRIDASTRHSRSVRTVICITLFACRLLLRRITQWREREKVNNA